MSPYAALLSVRQVEEQQAEVALAEALRDVATIGKLLGQYRQARAAWLSGSRGDGRLADGIQEALLQLEAAERETSVRLEGAEQVAEAARTTLLDRQRQRKVVERLHLEALAAAARASARRLQAEMDELGGRAARTLSGASS
ncbi:MAG: hypothetical protein HY216_10505 [Candidatus Rokubacteria bacterium]|nr:hypothetical protein [Candidatus Rokubacteria bacterium]